MNLESILENIVGPIEHYYRSEQCYVYLYIYTHIYKNKTTEGCQRTSGTHAVM